MKKVCMMAFLSTMSFSAFADSFPSKSVRFVVPLATGGGGDIVARIVAQSLSNIWNQNVIVDNRPGVGGNIGNTLVAKANPDGHTILFSTSTLAIGPAVYTNSLNVIKELEPLSLIAAQFSVILVNSNLPVKSLDELINFAKQKPYFLKYGSAGIGTASHLANELFAQKTNIKVTHIPYRSAGQSTQALLTNDIEFSVTNIATALSQLKSNRVHALAVTSNKRSEKLPNIPTAKELGVEYEYSTWYGMATPKSIDTGLQSKIYNDIMTSLKSEKVQHIFDSQGLQMIGSTPKEFAVFLAKEIGQWNKVVRNANIKVQ